MYDEISGKPLGLTEMLRQEVQIWASIIGEKLVFPEDLPLQKTYLPEICYTQGVLFGSEGTPPDVYGEGRYCPCGTKLNSYTPGPLCWSCGLKIFDFKQELSPLVIAFLYLFWQDLYKERVMTEKIINVKREKKKKKK